jgi:hypothetical protein
MTVTELADHHSDYVILLAVMEFDKELADYHSDNY